MLLFISGKTVQLKEVPNLEGFTELGYSSVLLSIADTMKMAKVLFPWDSGIDYQGFSFFSSSVNFFFTTFVLWIEHIYYY